MTARFGTRAPSAASLPKARSLVAFAAATVAFVACAGSHPAPPSQHPPQPPVAAGAPDAGPDAAPAAEEVPTVLALAARGPTDMPLMREVVRSEDATKPTPVELRAADACLRAVVAASVPVQAWFEDEKHAKRGAELSGASGLVPPRGPACARKGETLRLVVAPQAADTIARAVIWQAP